MPRYNTEKKEKDKQREIEWDTIIRRMKIYQDSIDKQFEFNQGKNLFYNGILNSLRFSPETLNAIEKIDLIDPDSENLLIDYLTNRAVQEFCKINQYFAFNKQAHLSLRNLYADLFTNIKNRKSSIDSMI